MGLSDDINDYSQLEEFGGIRFLFLESDIFSGLEA